MLRIVDKQGEATELHSTLVNRMWPSIAAVLELCPVTEFRLQTINKRAILNMAHFYTNGRFDETLQQLNRPTLQLIERIQIMSREADDPLVKTYMWLPLDEKVGVYMLARVTNNLAFINLFHIFFFKLAMSGPDAMEPLLKYKIADIMA